MFNISRNVLRIRPLSGRFISASKGRRCYLPGTVKLSDLLMKNPSGSFGGLIIMF